MSNRCAAGANTPAVPCGSDSVVNAHDRECHKRYGARQFSMLSKPMRLATASQERTTAVTAHRTVALSANKARPSRCAAHASSAPCSGLLGTPVPPTAERGRFRPCGGGSAPAAAAADAQAHHDEKACLRPSLCTAGAAIGGGSVPCSLPVGVDDGRAGRNGSVVGCCRCGASRRRSSASAATSGCSEESHSKSSKGSISAAACSRSQRQGWRLTAESLALPAHMPPSTAPQPRSKAAVPRAPSRMAIRNRLSGVSTPTRCRPRAAPRRAVCHPGRPGSGNGCGDARRERCDVTKDSWCRPVEWGTCRPCPGPGRCRTGGAALPVVCS